MNPGDTFGRMTVKWEIPSKGDHKRWFRCVCICGKEKDVRATHLRNNRVKSCGCSRRLNLSKEDVSNIERMLLGKVSHESIVEQLGVTKTAIVSVIKANDSMPRHIPVSKEDEDAMVFKYSQLGYSITALRMEFKRSDETIRSILRKNNIRLMGSRNKYPINEKCFLEKSNEAMYWMGLIAADGCIRSNNIRVKLHVNDTDTMESLRSFLGTERKIAIDGNCACLSFNSVLIKEALEAENITERKSHTFNPSDNCIDNKYFWRGMIDGDGSVMIKSDKYLSIMLCGSKYCVSAFEKWVKSICETKAGIVAHSSIFKFTVSGRHAEKVARILYSGDTSFGMQRKMISALKFISNGVV